MFISLLTDVCATFGCEQMCFVDEFGEALCLCGDGFDLNDDNKTCVGE
jgi:hypothetical protein